MKDLTRLLTEQPDGTWKVAGMEMLDKQVVRGYRLKHQGVDMCGWTDVREHPQNYIEHTRRDHYTGIEVDGVKCFENDEVEGTLFHGVVGLLTESFKGIVVFENGKYVIRVANKGSNYGDSYVFCELFSIDKTSKIIGIQGVKL